MGLSCEVELWEGMIMRHGCNLPRFTPFANFFF